MQYLLLGLYLLFTTSGLIFMKLGNNAGTIAINQGTLNFTINLVSMLGLFLYIISFLLFTKIVTSYDLSYILPILTGITQILSLIAALIIFKEHVTIKGFVGIALIIIGIIIMNFKK